MSERLLKLLSEKAPTLEKQVFCTVGQFGLASVAVYLDPAYIPDAQIVIGEDGVDLEGFGNVLPIYMWDKVHVGYCFELPTSMTTIGRDLILVARQRGVKMRLDRHTEVLYYDEMINVVSSKRNDLIIIAPNKPSIIRGIADGTSVT